MAARRASSDSLGGDRPLPRFMSPTRASAFRGILTQNALTSRERAPYSAAPVPMTATAVPKEAYADGTLPVARSIVLCIRVSMCERVLAWVWMVLMRTRVAGTGVQ